MNIFLAAIFILLDMLYPSASFSIGSASRDVFFIGALVNTWLAIFNLIPLGPLDGAKIFNWDKSVWVAALVVAVVLLGMEVLFL
jgi:Zn-dependent protease